MLHVVSNHNELMTEAEETASQFLWDSCWSTICRTMNKAGLTLTTNTNKAF